MAKTSGQDEIEEPITSAPSEVEQIIRSVIRLERENLHYDKPRVKSDILKIIKENIK